MTTTDALALARAKMPCLHSNTLRGIASDSCCENCEVMETLHNSAADNARLRAEVERLTAFVEEARSMSHSRITAALAALEQL